MISLAAIKTLVQNMPDNLRTYCILIIVAIVLYITTYKHNSLDAFVEYCFAEKLTALIRASEDTPSYRQSQGSAVLILSSCLRPLLHPRGRISW